jgi:hypothetical protein
MRKATVAAAVVLLASCSSDGGDMSPSEAFCSDLRSGLSVFQILQPQVESGRYTPEQAADRAYGFAAISCPDELRNNQGLRGYLEGWGINPDA